LFGVQRSDDVAQLERASHERDHDELHTYCPIVELIDKVGSEHYRQCGGPKENPFACLTRVPWRHQHQTAHQQSESAADQHHVGGVTEPLHYGYSHDSCPIETRVTSCFLPVRNFIV